MASSSRRLGQLYAEVMLALNKAKAVFNGEKGCILPTQKTKS
jgi:hypothetical protein